MANYYVYFSLTRATFSVTIYCPSLDKRACNGQQLKAIRIGKHMTDDNDDDDDDDELKTVIIMYSIFTMFLNLDRSSQQVKLGRQR